MNRLYYGDNLAILQRIQDGSVDLIYLDPPFNSQQNYNHVFKERDGVPLAQIKAFEDTWSWNEKAAEAFDELLVMGGPVADTVVSFRSFLGPSKLMAYLAMMARRIVELHRVLRSTGSLYLHCDPTASHYLKILLDAVFTPKNFVNEIVWRRTSAHNDARTKYAAVHDILLFYSKGPTRTWNVQYEQYSEEYIATHFVHQDGDGRRFRRVDLRSPSPRPNLVYDYTASNGVTYKPHRNGWAVSRDRMEELDRQGKLFFPAKRDGRLRKKQYLDESPGVPVSDNWIDIKPIFATHEERLGFPTQKPVALLERILKASTNLGDVVLDPFCGCGTTIDAAQTLEREWVGIDIAYVAIRTIKRRLHAKHGHVQYLEEGEPTTMDEAEALAALDPLEFQAWVLSRLRGSKVQVKAGADRGVDDRIYFRERGNDKPKQIIVSVKSGHTAVSHLRDLSGVVTREKAAIGVLVTLQQPTKAMVREAADGGFYTSPWGKYPRLQVVTVEELLNGKSIQYPQPRGSNAITPSRRRSGKTKSDQTQLEAPLFTASVGGGHSRASSGKAKRQKRA